MHTLLVFSKVNEDWCHTLSHPVKFKVKAIIRRKWIFFIPGGFVGLGEIPVNQDKTFNYLFLIPRKTTQ